MAFNEGLPVVTEPSRDSTPYKTMATSGDTPILDIRIGATEFDILKDIKKGLRPEDGGEKRLPTLLLYDEAGLRLFENITYLDEYYLTNAEIEVSRLQPLVPLSLFSRDMFLIFIVFSFNTPKT